MHVKVKNLSLTYPVISSESYLEKKSFFHFTKDKFNNLKNKKEIKDIKALNNINLEINEGDKVGLIGLNGSGKSTLLKCLSNILDPDHGSEIDISGSFVPILNPMVFCESEDTLVNNIILMGLLFHFKKKFILEKIDEILKFSELENYRNLPFGSLSTGMMFRLVFAICFILKKDIYFIDEFLTTGDERFQNKGFEFIKSTFKKNIIILCSHSQRVINTFCDKVIIINKGEKIFFGDVSEGLEIYRNLIRK